MGSQNFNKPAKAKVVATLPKVGNAEIGELYYDTTNNRLYVRVISGWKYLSVEEE